MEGRCAFPVREDVHAEQGMIKIFIGKDAVAVSGAFTGSLTTILPDGSDRPSVNVTFSGWRGQ